jgi:hypothetical protein
MKWTKIDEQQSNYAAVGYVDYINEDGTIVRREWNDGYVEEYEVD